MAETCPEILARLTEAKTALSSLLRGGAVRSIQDTDGSRIEYTSANPSRLVSYVALLEAQYAACISGNPTVVTRPVNFFF